MNQITQKAKAPCDLKTMLLEHVFVWDYNQIIGKVGSFHLCF